MALGAHEIPILQTAGPMQNITRIDLLVGIKMKPTLAAHRLRPRVPTDVQRLIAPVRKSDEILLQRVIAERVSHFVFVQLAVGAIGVNEKLAVLFIETGSQAIISERGIIEIAKHGLLVG